MNKEWLRLISSIFSVEPLVKTKSIDKSTIDIGIVKVVRLDESTFNVMDIDSPIIEELIADNIEEFNKDKESEKEIK